MYSEQEYNPAIKATDERDNHSAVRIGNNRTELIMMMMTNDNDDDDYYDVTRSFSEEGSPLAAVCLPIAGECV